MINLPGDDASDEEKKIAMDKIFQKLGKPESADNYELNKDVIRDKQKEYYQKNRDVIREKCRLRYKMNSQTVTDE